jgi:hypothetical protein
VIERFWAHEFRIQLVDWPEYQHPLSHRRAVRCEQVRNSPCQHLAWSSAVELLASPSWTPPPLSFKRSRPICSRKPSRVVLRTHLEETFILLFEVTGAAATAPGGRRSAVALAASLGTSRAFDEACREPVLTPVHFVTPCFQPRLQICDYRLFRTRDPWSRRTFGTSMPRSSEWSLATRATCAVTQTPAPFSRGR